MRKSFSSFGLIRFLPALVLLLIVAALHAETLTLKDGTVLEGTVVPQGDKYWIKLPDGSSRFIPKADVAQVGGAAATPGAVKPAGGGMAFPAVKAKADKVEAPLTAVVLWQKFIDANPGSPDLKQAQEQLAKWQTMADEGAELVRGKWIVGAERRTMINESYQMLNEGMELMGKGKMLDALDKVIAADKRYPNSHDIKMALGILCLRSDKPEEAKRHFMMALERDKSSAAAMNNIGVAMLWQRDQDIRGAVNRFKQSVRMSETKDNVANLLTALISAPPALRAEFKKEFEMANLLASRHGVAGAGQLHPMYPKEGMKYRTPAGEMAGILSSGSGSIIREDGLVLTNRHVVEHGDSFLILLGDNTKRSAELLKMSNDMDLALMKIKGKPGEKFPVAPLAEKEPANGAFVYALGYPVPSKVGATLKVTQGIITGFDPDTSINIVIDLKLNPGNSGGPLYNQFGQVVGVNTVKFKTEGMVEAYGGSIGVGNVQKFLKGSGYEIAAGKPTSEKLNAQQTFADRQSATVCVLTVGEK